MKFSHLFSNITTLNQTSFLPRNNTEMELGHLLSRFHHHAVRSLIVIQYFYAYLQNRKVRKVCNICPKTLTLRGTYVWWMDEFQIIIIAVTMLSYQNIWKRYLVTALAFVGCFLMYSLRIILGIALIEMTSEKTIVVGDKIKTIVSYSMYIPTFITVLLSKALT